MLYILLVSCPSLDNPSNGMISCSLRDDAVPSYEDTCNFTCNAGYELAGSDTRTCQSDGSWSGSTAMCTIGEWLLMCILMISLYSCTNYELHEELYRPDRYLMCIIIYNDHIAVQNLKGLVPVSNGVKCSMIDIVICNNNITNIT